jgi:hypothetical protein
VLDPRVQQFHEHVTALGDELGIELDDDDRRALFDQSVAQGFTPATTEQAFASMYGGDDDDFEEDDAPLGDLPEGPQQPRRDFHADLAHDLAELQRELGRKLTDSEVEGIGQRAMQQVQRHDDFFAGAALEDFHQDRGTNPDKSTWKSSDWNDFMVERARALDPESNRDSGREEYDLSDAKQWEEYAYLKLTGTADFADAPAAEPEEDSTDAPT